MSTPLRVRRRRGQKAPEGTVFVSTETRWGDTFKSVPGYSMAERVWNYRNHMLPYSHKDGDLWRFLRAEASIKAIQNDLRGLNLACWCKLCPKHDDGKPFGELCPDCAPCHADVLGQIANGELLHG